ncbi:MAG TPA: hypothetical protein VNF68_02910, partial [Candidatus Baltobacteraceae bacterium]|nr:hypothetical protein [Candidatus Baltobacteraceae bacterium]
KRFYNTVTRAQVLLHFRPTQIEIAIFKAEILIYVVVGINLERRHVGAVQNVEMLDAYFDRSGENLRVFGTCGALPHRTDGAHDIFVSQPFGERKTWMLWVKHDLR